ncbi:conserved hypothetical protein [Ricinus communis]|uniref:Uncharacterized protein n=1 Tax=Ricinus communis TaxID=3988 RepID=B9RE06_RICCO|nr:conserved hypothetical protein [Ricinus communis]
MDRRRWNEKDEEIYNYLKAYGMNAIAEFFKLQIVEAALNTELLDRLRTYGERGESSSGSSLSICERKRQGLITLMEQERPTLHQNQTQLIQNSSHGGTTSKSTTKRKVSGLLEPRSSHPSISQTQPCYYILESSETQCQIHPSTIIVTTQQQQNNPSNSLVSPHVLTFSTVSTVDSSIIRQSFAIPSSSFTFIPTPPDRTYSSSTAIHQSIVFPSTYESQLNSISTLPITYPSSTPINQTSAFPSTFAPLFTSIPTPAITYPSSTPITHSSFTAANNPVHFTVDEKPFPFQFTIDELENFISHSPKEDEDAQ